MTIDRLTESFPFILCRAQIYSVQNKLIFMQVWDVELEMLASEWSANCALKFGTPPHTANNLQRLGQNIYVSRGKPRPLHWRTAYRDPIDGSHIYTFQETVTMHAHQFNSMAFSKLRLTARIMNVSQVEYIYRNSDPMCSESDVTF